MPIPKNFVSYVKASWLADLPFEEFLRLSQREITLANAIFTNLDCEYYQFKIADYGDVNFFNNSSKLDRKHHA